MKSTRYLHEITTVIGIAATMTFLLSSACFSQEKEVKKDAKGTVKLRIEKDINGKKTVIDTTFNLNDRKGEEAYEIFMKEYDTPGRHHHARKNIELHLSDLGKLDSLDPDSLGNIEKRIRVFTGDGKHFRMEGIGGDETFDLPAPPEPPEPPAPPCWERNEMPQAPGFDEAPGNLLNVLRSIPMNRVKNFRIKENKHGTRIIIDVDRASVLEMPPFHDRMIYMNKHRMNNRMGNPDRHRFENRIIIEKEKEEKGDK